MISLELKIPPLALLAMVAISIWGLSVLLPSGQVDFPGVHWVAAILGGAGLLIPLCGVLAFNRARTTVDPRFPAQSVQLIQTGVYQFSRNPMYLGFLLLLTGWTFYLGNGAGFLLLPLFVLYLNRFQIEPEERILLEKFGAPYRDYLNDVRRWI
ncbi:MAG: methyltransferase family protein [Porticoccaceae bacterium]